MTIHIPRILLLGLAAGLASGALALLGQQWPEIQRYLKVERM